MIPHVNHCGKQIGRVLVTDLTGQNIGRWHLVSRLNDPLGSYQAVHIETRQPARICVQSINWIRPDEFMRHIQPYLALEDEQLFSVLACDIEENWVVMHLPPYGETVLDRLRSQGAFSLHETLEILGSVAAALDAGHALGVVHGDLKPYSILVDGRLMDWGLRSTIDRCDPPVEAVIPKSFLAYWAFEQIKGDKLLPSAERYSLVAIAFEMLTGNIIYHSLDVLPLIMDYINGKAVPPVPAITQENPMLPAILDVVFERGLARDPDERFESAMAFVEAMASCI